MVDSCVSGASAPNILAIWSAWSLVTSLPKFTTFDISTISTPSSFLYPPIASSITPLTS